ncbi:MAG: acyl-CoA thioesterase [Armatimonadota bacterium]
MAHEFRLVRTVEFSETDMAGIMHFANFFRYMEVTEHAFLRSLGLSVHFEHEGRTLGWPRVNVSCDYRAPLRFEDRVEVHLRVREKREKSLTYEFRFRKLSGDAPLEVARGSVTAVCVCLDPETRTMKAVPIPPVFAEQIETAPPESEGEGVRA